MVSFIAQTYTRHQERKYEKEKTDIIIGCYCMNLFPTILYIVCPIEMIERIILAKKKSNFVVIMMIQIKKCTGKQKNFIEIFQAPTH